MVDAVSGIQQSLNGGKVSPRSEAENSRVPASRDPARPDSAESQEASRVVEAGTRPGAGLQASSGEDSGSEALADRAARELAETKPFFRPELEFKVDDDSGRTVITVFNPETDEVIRQIPPEQALALAQQLREQQEEGGSGAVSLIQTRA